MDFTDSTIRHDRVIVVEGQRFYVYSGYLSFFSEFFATMFTANFNERNQQEIVLHEIAAEDFHLFLKTLVPGNNSFITAENYCTVMACARRFIAPFILTMCKTYILANYENLDKIELLEVAFEYDWNELKEKLTIDLTEASETNEQCPKNCDATYVRNYCSKCCYTFPTNYKQCEHQHSAEFYLKNCVNCGSIFKSSGPLDTSSFFVKNKEKMAALSDEINAFIFKALLNNADK